MESAHRKVLATNSDASERRDSQISPDGSELYSTSETDQTLHSFIGFKTKLYAKRYLILILFILFSMSNAFQWIEYAIIQNIVTKYYNTSVFWVNCTSVVYMVCYIIGIIPATWLLERKGLRYCILLGALGNCLGSWVKCFSASPNRFWVTMIGQTIVASSQLYVLSIPPQLAAVWFPENEVSRATAYGVFGNQLGIALGFFIPHLVVPSFSKQIVNSSVDELLFANNTVETNSDEVGSGLKTLFLSVSIFTSLLLIAICLLFSDKPDYPPSVAQANAVIVNENVSYYHSLYTLITDTNFLILFLTYGLNAGIFYGLSTDLNLMITNVFGDDDDITEYAGYMGVIITIAGIIGSIVCGYLLDWTRMFKQITLGVYILSLMGMIAFTGALFLEPVIWPLFVVCGFLGFFMTGYLPIGFELAAEISYPHAEGTSAGLLNTSAQIFGTIFTFGGSAILERFGYLSVNICFITVLLTGTVFTKFIKPDYKRMHAIDGKNLTNSSQFI